VEKKINSNMVIKNIRRINSISLSIKNQMLTSIYKELRMNNLNKEKENIERGKKKKGVDTNRGRITKYQLAEEVKCRHLN
jgi:hypothetical protein